MQIALSLDEKALFKLLGDRQDLRSSINEMRDSLIKLWDQDASPIIKNFVRHDIVHSQNIAKYANMLIKDNKLKLSTYEAYLLLAGIYLHDIGMRCDIYYHDNIRQEALKLGAKFTIDFTRNNSSDISFEDQMDIRKNHNYISAAWISFEAKCNEKNTALFECIKLIPKELVRDVMDICMYHAKLDIKKCEKHFLLLQENRKQFVATLLRICDELDIEMGKVDINMIKSYNIPPERKIFHYMHDHTKINIINGNIIKIEILLSHEDKVLTERYFEQKIIDDFKEKNREVLKVLQDYGLSLFYSENCGVIEYEYSGKIPEDIMNLILNEMNENQLTHQENETTDIKKK